MVERPAARALPDDAKLLAYIVFVVIVGIGLAIVWGWTRELDTGVRVVVGLSAAAVTVVLAIAGARIAAHYFEQSAAHNASVAGRLLTRTLPDSRVALESARDARPVSGHEWMHMATEFRNVRDLAIRAEWHKDPDRESWELAGSMPAALENTSVLCQRAGAMLLRSPRVAAGLSERVRAHRSPVDRWLEFIREQPQTRMQVIDMSHTIPIPVEDGYIRDVPSVSARVCMACSADEG
jgi:hypothetical protein